MRTIYFVVQSARCQGIIRILVTRFLAVRPAVEGEIDVGGRLPYSR
jgi:hypothetical protein